MKLYGTIKPVHGSGLPPFEAEIVDLGAWVQLDYLPSGETWIRADMSGLLRCYSLVRFAGQTDIHIYRVIDPPAASADPAVAETETGVSQLHFYMWYIVYTIGRYTSIACSVVGHEIGLILV